MAVCRLVLTTMKSGRSPSHPGSLWLVLEGVACFSAARCKVLLSECSERRSAGSSPIAERGRCRACPLSALDRGVRPTLKVFLRTNAPRVPLAGPASIGHIVRGAMAQAEVERPKQIAAHLFRHTLASRILQQGHSQGRFGDTSSSESNQHGNLCQDRHEITQ